MSVTIHDDTDVYVPIYERCSKTHETIVEGRANRPRNLVLVAKDKSNHPAADSLRSVPQESLERQQLYQEKRMIGGIGNMFVSVQCPERPSDRNLKQAWVNVHHDSLKEPTSLFFLLPPLVVSSLFPFIFFPLFLCLLSVSVSLCLSLRDVEQLLCLVCVCVCACVCLCVLGEEERRENMFVRSKRPAVSQNVKT